MPLICDKPNALIAAVILREPVIQKLGVSNFHSLEQVGSDGSRPWGEFRCVFGTFHIS